MNKTKIEWCDKTWNPVTGCLHGCEYCYARKITNRFGGNYCDDVDREIHCLDKPLYKAISNKYADGEEVYAKEIITHYPYYFDPTFHKYRLDEPQRVKKPQNIFVCSMADLFGSWVPDEWITDVFEACNKAPQHKYLFLTKNYIRYLMLADKGILPTDNNFWWGITITNQVDYDNMGTALFNLNKKYHTFFSIEPIHENIEMGLMPEWLIIGSETGSRKNKIKVKREWIEDIVHQCANEKVFMKDSLINIVGEENMLREFPEGLKK